MRLGARGYESDIGSAQRADGVESLKRVDSTRWQIDDEMEE